MIIDGSMKRAGLAEQQLPSKLSTTMGSGAGKQAAKNRSGNILLSSAGQSSRLWMCDSKYVGNTWETPKQVVIQAVILSGRG